MTGKGVPHRYVRSDKPKHNGMKWQDRRADNEAEAARKVIRLHRIGFETRRLPGEGVKW